MLGLEKYFSDWLKIKMIVSGNVHWSLKSHNVIFSFT